MTNFLLNAINFTTLYFPFLVQIALFVAIIIITKIAAQKLSPKAEQLCQKNDVDKHSCIMFGKFIYSTIMILGSLIALQNIGVNISMFIAAFGVTGIVVSYGMKDIVANFIAGILIMSYKQFKITDYIKITGWEGQVVDINIQYTTIKTNDSTVFIPNIILYTNPVAIVHTK